MDNEISREKIDKYFSVTKAAIDMVKEKGLDESRKADAEDFFDMAKRYYDDAEHFFNKGDWVLAFAALNYSHGWLDAGARIKLFKVNDSKLFTVDED